jgi:hypothetical protein
LINFLIFAVFDKKKSVRPIFVYRYLDLERKLYDCISRYYPACCRCIESDYSRRKKRKGSLIPEIFSIDSVDPKNIKNYYLQLSPSRIAWLRRGDVTPGLLRPPHMPHIRCCPGPARRRPVLAMPRARARTELIGWQWRRKEFIRCRGQASRARLQPTRFYSRERERPRRVRGRAMLPGGKGVGCFALDPFLLGRRK